MKKKVITIGREYGSGGRELGKRLAEKLGYTYYDKELLAVAAKVSGLSEKVLAKQDEKQTNSFLYSLVMETRTLTGQQSLEEMLHQAQKEAILEVAREGGCVIVGRCADYVLRDYENLLRIFIAADEKQRIERVCSRENCKPEEAVKKIRKAEKSRAAYYQYQTGQTWGYAGNYDLCINLSRTNADQVIDFVKNL